MTLREVVHRTDTVQGNDGRIYPAGSVNIEGATLRTVIKITDSGISTDKRQGNVGNARDQVPFSCADERARHRAPCPDAQNAAAKSVGCLILIGIGGSGKGPLRRGMRGAHWCRGAGRDNCEAQISGCTFVRRGTAVAACRPKLAWFERSLPKLEACRAQKKGGPAPLSKNRANNLATTYSRGTYRPTTIGCSGLNGRVRDGNGWAPGKWSPGSVIPR